MKQVACSIKNQLKCLSLVTFVFFIPAQLKSHDQEWHNVQNKLKTNPFKFVSITIPKSGTHLLAKCIHLMHAQDPAADRHNFLPTPKGEAASKKCQKISKKSFLELQKKGFKKRILQKNHQKKMSFHLIHTPDYEKFVKRSAKSALFLIRDPRDQLVSFTKWACTKSKYGTADFSKMLLNFIDGKQREDTYSVRMHRVCNVMWSRGIAGYYSWYLPWMAVDNVYTVRFEKLVGVEGGGSREAQIQEIVNIANHLKIKLSPSKINDIAGNLFGGTNTFNKGQIGSWKEHFTKEHKQAFKKVAGQLLIDLGYEKDLNW